MSKHYHLIGIGGIGMSGIAQLLLRRGEKVSGSDLKESDIIKELKNLGGRIFIGHHPSNIQGAEIVIYSSAIKEDNPEIQEAKRRGITLIRRAQALADLMKNETVIAITGSHGKTTTASLVSYLLMQAGLCPTVAIGGILRNIDNNACLGEGRFFVAEADESDGTFLYYQPKYSIVTNIDREHLDYYKDFDSEIKTFREFLDRTSPEGCVFCCGDDENLRTILKDYKNKYVLFGLHKNDAHIFAANIMKEGLTSKFDCFYKDRFVGRFHLALGGSHNICNALAVIALGMELEIDLEIIRNTLSTFKGARRRIEIKFEDKDYLVIDDYAHHPTEIKATLETIRTLRKRVVVIFQPHRYSRTQLLLDDFSRCFDIADYVVITDIYAAGEMPLEGVSGRAIYDKIKEYTPYREIFFSPKEEIVTHILSIIRSGDLVITLGAGDINKISDELAKSFKR